MIYILIQVILASINSNSFIMEVKHTLLVIGSFGAAYRKAYKQSMLLFSSCLFVSLLVNFTLHAQSPFLHRSYEKVVAPNVAPDILFIDMNQDGALDLASHDYQGYKFFKSNGITIDSLDFYTYNFSSSSTSTLADWNNDNLPDILSNYLSFQVRQNLGNFDFSNPVEVSPSTYSNIKTNDINDDGYIDAYSVKHNSVELYMNQNGSFTSTNYPINLGYNIDSYETEVKFLDIENDGLKEMLIKAFDDKIYIYSHTGAFNYILQDSLVSTDIGPVGASSMYLFDLNNDGAEEIITRDGWNINVFERSVAYNYGLVFSGNAYYTVDTGFGFAALTEISDFYDVDGNGFLDIIVGNSIFFNNSNFAFNEFTINTVPRLYDAKYKCADVDSNGFVDVCFVYDIVNTFFEEGFYRCEYSGGQTLEDKSLIWYNWGVPGEHTVDFDNDGDVDVFSFDPGKVILWENILDTLYPKYMGPGLDYYADKVNIVDINLDGFFDILWSTNTAAIDEHGFVLNNSGQNLIMNTIFANSEMSLKLIDDIDNDGVEELFYHLKTGFTDNSILMYRLNTGVPVLASTLSSWTDFSVEDVVVRLADIDADGLKDLIVQQENSGSNKIRTVKYNGLNSFTAGQIINIGGGLELVGVFDSNNDLQPDLHWIDGANRIYRNINNNGIFEGAQQFLLNPYSFGSTNHLGFSVDFDNDYLIDLIVQTYSQIFYFKNLGTSLQLIHHDSSIQGLKRPMDIDNDGDSDLMASSTWLENVSTSDYYAVGTVFYDINTNGVYDAGVDVKFPLFPLVLNSNWLSTTTDSQGEFEMALGSVDGNYSIGMSSAVAGNFVTTSMPYPCIASVSSSNPTDSISLGVTSIGNVIDGKLDVSISGHRCNENGRVFIEFQNYSPEFVDLNLKLTLAENTSFISSNFNASQSIDTLIWDFTSLAPFEVVHCYADLDMPGTANMGDTMQFVSIATLNSFSGSSVVMDTLRQILTCAYDPNDKNIVMSETIFLGDTTFSLSNEIEYLIRFQNTGNDTAQNIVIKDYLSNYFDWTSVHKISSSHSSIFTVDSAGAVTITFNDINLPDSNVNFLGSMGYVKLKLALKDNAPHGEVINNYAMIFFDLNPPIYTNVNHLLRMDCRDFVNITNSGLDLCYSDTLLIVNDDFGLPFEYEWEIDSYTTFSEDEALLPFSNYGAQNFNLSLTSTFCSIDSTIELQLIQSPTNILTVSGDTAVCSNEQFYTESDVITEWYIDGIYDHTGNTFQNIVDTNYLVWSILTNAEGCSDTVEINISEITLPDHLHNYESSTLFWEPTYYVCEGDSIRITSNYDSISFYISYMDLPGLSYGETSMETSFFMPPGETFIEVYMNYTDCYFEQIIYFELDDNIPLELSNIPSSIQCVETVLVSSNRVVDWYLNGNLISEGALLEITEPGFYEVGDQCGHQDSFFVNASNQSDTIVESIDVCEGSNYIAPDGFEYTNISTDFVHESNFINASGCDSIVISNISVNVGSFVDTIYLCQGSDYEYSDGTQVTNIQTDQYYSYQLVSSLGCDSIIETHLILDNIVSYSINSEPNELIVIPQVGSTIQWLNCDMQFEPLIGQTNESLGVTSSGSYAAQLTFLNCQDTTDCIDIIYLNTASIQSDGFTYYPNPVSTNLEFEFEQIEKYLNFEVYDSYGRLVISNQFESTIAPVLNLSNLESGSYSVRIYTSSKTVNIQVLKI